MTYTAPTPGANVSSEQPRHRDGVPHGGQWRQRQREGSGLTLHGEGERQGSALFPPRFRGWSAREYVDWWENVPLDDEVLMNTQRAYKDHMERAAYDHCLRAVDEWKERNPDPTLPTSPRLKRDDIPPAIYQWKEGVDKAWTEADEEFFTTRARSLPDSTIRPVYRAHKMQAYSVQLAEAEREKVMNHVMPIRDGMTVRDAAAFFTLEPIDKATRTKHTDALLERLSIAIDNQNRGEDNEYE